ncbi:dihydrofolate reductase [Nakamurella sp. UYEF19]|uniref:dihydrofolate reductase family protein n=1 Tax=Nakamurella sp. UYEF19 TaxID=1756392 RepID=UPI0033974F32
MARLIYSAIASLDGYVEDTIGAFDWSAPDDEVLAFLTDLERPVGTYLYGRRMYETMTYWESPDVDAGPSEPERDFAQLWQAADKIVYSRTLSEPTTVRTRLERSFDPADVRQLKQSATSDLSIGGADLGGQALAAGLVDECQLFLTPTAVGGGKPAFPLGVRLQLELLDQHRFAAGTVFLRYAVLPAGESLS